jgi:hypothetical protein
MNKTWWSRLLLAATMALALTGGAVATATPALATANVCTSISGQIGDHMCTYINGSGTYVNYARVAVYRIAPQSICNYYATFTVYDSSGVKIYTKTSSYHSGCIWGYFASRQIDVYKRFPNNSKACGSWFQDGGRLGTSCARLHT